MNSYFVLLLFGVIMLISPILGNSDCFANSHIAVINCRINRSVEDDGSSKIVFKPQSAIVFEEKPLTLAWSKGYYSTRVDTRQAIVCGILDFGALGRVRLGFNKDVTIVINEDEVRRDRYGFMVSGVCFEGEAEVIAAFFHDYHQYYFQNLLLRDELKSENRMPKHLSFEMQKVHVDSVFEWLKDADNCFFAKHPNYVNYSNIAYQFRCVRRYTDYLNIFANSGSDITSLKEWVDIKSTSPSFYDRDIGEFYAALKRLVGRSVNKGVIVSGSDGWIPFLIENFPEMDIGLRDSLGVYLDMKLFNVDLNHIELYEKDLMPKVFKQYGGALNLFVIEPYLDKTIQMFDPPLADMVMLQFCPRDLKWLSLYWKLYGGRFTDQKIKERFNEISNVFPNP
jgi:hypothetical protein